MMLNLILGLAMVGLQAADTTDPCADTTSRGDRRQQVCEVREHRLPAGTLTVDAGPNGGIRVEAWDGPDILVRAAVRAWGDTEAEARSLAQRVEVAAGAGRVSAQGSSTGSRQHWSVSYRIQVPRRTDLDLSTRNGGITITGVEGRVRFDSRNGGVHLTDLAGDVTGRTRNGGVTVMLGGSRWEGTGLDVETANGGVRLNIPESYSARLETQTNNGRFRSEYPLTVTGELIPRRGLSATLGSGGAPVKVRTRNGGISVSRR